MIILGLLLLLGAAGVSFVAFRANETVLNSPVGTIELFGRHAEITGTQLFLVGAGAGALVMISLMLLFGGMGRRARRVRHAPPVSEPIRTTEREKELASR